MKRRVFLGGAAAVLAMPAVAAGNAKRVFRILRDGSDIGTHTLEAVSGPNGFEIDIVIRIQVKILGVTAYRYELDNREVWKGGNLISLDSKVNDDGTRDFASATRSGDALAIKGSRYTGDGPGSAATTSYFVPELLERAPWISTQSGALLPIRISPEGRTGWNTVTGGLDTKLGYEGGEWTGCEFDAGGEPGTYEIISQSGSFRALWTGA